MATLKKNVIINSAKCPLLNPPSQHQDFFSEVTPEGWPWWPWWPSTIGRDSRRPTANPRLASGYPRASASIGVESVCPSQPRIFFPEVSPRGWPWWPWWPSTIGRVQISDAAVRANAWLWFGLGAHPGGLGVHNARDTPCPKPEVCSIPRRTSVQARPYRLRSARNATCRPGAAGWGGTVVFGRRVLGSSLLKGTRELHKLHKCLGMRCSPWQWHEPAGPKGDRNDAHASSEGRASNWDGPPSCPLTLRPHDGRQKPHDQSQSRAPAALASFWLCMGGEGRGGGQRFA